MKPSLMTTAEIVAYFKAGLSMHELAVKDGVTIQRIEKAIRRWLVVYPAGCDGRKR